MGISTNGGVTWEEILINEGLWRDLRPNPERVMLNISSMIAGENANVQIRFRYEAIWDYGWQVDNIGIFELPPYELVMNSGFVSHSGDGTEYGRIPSNQFGTEIYIGAELFNAGSEPLTQIQLNIEVHDQDNELVYSTELMQASMASWDTVLIGEVITVPTALPGIYSASFTATAFENDMEIDIDNNTDSRIYEINESLYALDAIGLYPPGQEQTLSIGTASFLNNADALLLMNYFAISEPVLVHGLQFDLA